MLNKDFQIFFYRDLGKVIKEKRALKKISQGDLAKAINLSRVSVVNIEKGIQKVQVHTLVQMANILELNLDDLKSMISIDSDSIILDKNYQNRIEQSEAGNLKNLKKNFLEIKKHL